jgi:hypothetical protein
MSIVIVSTYRRLECPTGRAAALATIASATCCARSPTNDAITAASAWDSVQRLSVSRRCICDARRPLPRDRGLPALNGATGDCLSRAGPPLLHPKVRSIFAIKFCI